MKNMRKSSQKDFKIIKKNITGKLNYMTENILFYLKNNI